MKNPLFKTIVNVTITLLIIVATALNAQTANSTSTNVDKQKAGKVTDGKIMPASFKNDSIKVAEEPERVYTVIEQMPVFPGGDEALMNFISGNIKYPVEAFQYNEQGKVIVRFVVNKEGKVEKAQVIRGVSSSVDRESLRVVNLIPDFTPGKQNGKVVNVYYTLPITFRLDPNNNNNYNFNNWADPKIGTRGKKTSQPNY